MRRLVVGITSAFAVAAVCTIGVLAIPPAAVAQESAPLASLADLVLRKGFKNTDLGQLCGLFHPRIKGGGCKVVSLAADEDDLKGADYPKGWTPTFEVYVEQGTGIVRVIIVTQSPKTGAKGIRTGYAFLANVDGKPEIAASGHTVNGLWQWSAVSLTADLRAIFAREVSVWLKQQKSIEALPDRKD